MSFGTFKHRGQSRIRERWGQTNEIIAELTNYHHFHPLTACDINGVMALVRFIVVFVWEAFALWSHLLQHIAHPLECIMEMNIVVIVCADSFFFKWQLVFSSSLVCSEGEAGEKKKESTWVSIQG